MDKLDLLSKDHVLTKIKGCELSNGKAKSVQLTFGVWKNGKATNKIKLNEFGDISGNCKSFTLDEND